MCIRDRFIKYEEVPLAELGRLDRYDFVLGFGMGLRMTAGQRETLQQAADKGTPVYIYAATNPENNICNLDSITKADITSYIGNGNKKNYRNMARYIRCLLYTSIRGVGRCCRADVFAWSRWCSAGGCADDRAVGVDRRTSSIYGAFRPSDFRCLSVVFS